MHVYCRVHTTPAQPRSRCGALHAGERGTPACGQDGQVARGGGAPVNVCGGLVQREYARVRQEGSREAQKLPLPGAEVAASLRHRRAQAAERFDLPPQLHGLQ